MQESSPLLMQDRPVGLPLVRLMARNWWVFALRGAAGILFGLVAFLAPGLGLSVLLTFLGAWMLLDGVGSIYQAVTQEDAVDGSSKAWLWVDGTVALGDGIFILAMPGAAAFGLVIATGAWFVVGGIARLMLAFRLSSFPLGGLGAIGVLVGAWLIVSPGAGLLAVMWLIGLAAIAIGALMISFGWRLRRVHTDPGQ